LARARLQEAQTPRSRRDRTIIFRLTQAEYDRLRLACAAAGARTLSEYTRSELLDACAAGSEGSANSRRFHSIDEKLEELKTMMKRISERVPPEAT
jgi:hypothetical protein